MSTFEKRCQLAESSVVGITEPAFDEDPVVWLILEVLWDVIHDDYPGHVPSYPGEILHEARPIGKGVLSVQPMFDVPCLINEVEDPVSVLVVRRNTLTSCMAAVNTTTSKYLAISSKNS